MIVLFLLLVVIVLAVSRIIFRVGLIAVPFEASTQKKPSSMLTLTYNDEHLPKDRSVSVEDTTNFNKRLRYYLDYYFKRKVKLYWSSEYGDEDFRPHYHYMVFGLDANNPHDMECVHRAWSDRKKNPIGYWDLVPLVPGRIRYVMKYVNKEFSTDWLDEYSKRGLKPLFHSCSNGIGFDWFIQNLEHIIKNDGCYYIDGVKRPLNRYYRDLFKTIKNVSLYERYKPMIEHFESRGVDYSLSHSLPLLSSDSRFHNFERERFMRHMEFLEYDS